MHTQAVVLEEPGRISIADLAICDPAEDDVIVEVERSGISTGTEKLLWSGKMPHFPGLAYPLVPGYETVGTVVEAGPESGRKAGDRVFVPGANCYGEVRGLFGGAASHLVAAGRRTVVLSDAIGDEAILVALAATAWHAIDPERLRPPELIVGHGALGRLVARTVIATGGKPPTVWEVDPRRRDGAEGYRVVDPAEDDRRDYHRICDVSGDADILDTLIGRLARGGEIALAGFYDRRVSFSFPPAFMREARMRVAAEWRPEDLVACTSFIEAGALSLKGLITHTATPAGVEDAYRTAFEDPACLKMVLDWSKLS
ncbi:MAG: chlorophyll synthesis pathway protein BchC [Aliihoeflea sp.]|jgi:3-hydroxyethyl bacteriochlorophyllide a dehydrogenase